MKPIFFLCLLLNGISGWAEGETVVCVHGFMRKGGNMSAMVRAFEKEGFNVVNWTYPSREKTIAGHAEDLVKVLQSLDGSGPVHFVTHSMGGLIVRAALNHPECPETAKQGKAVLLAPPNGGSAFGRSLHRFSFVRYMIGEYAGEELTTEPNFDYLGNFPDGMKVLVIAGEYDKKVACEETCLPTPHLHETVPSPHFWIAHHPGSVRKAKQFILSLSSE